MNEQLPRLEIRLNIYCGGEVAMCPGKAKVLDAIDLQGSISGAARNIDISYRHAWLMVDAMNRCWKQPLVATFMGGVTRGGGARLTAFGHEMLAAYRFLEGRTEQIREEETWLNMLGGLLSEPCNGQRIEPIFRLPKPPG